MVGLKRYFHCWIIFCLRSFSHQHQ